MTRAVGVEAVAQEFAETFRSEHHLGTQPIGDLITVIEQATGVDVAVLDVDQAEHGMAARSSRSNTTFIAVARTRNPMRQRSSLAHELGHVIFGDWYDGRAVDMRDPLEVRADTFSRHLLLPEAGVREAIGDRSNLTEADLSALVQFFQVSPAIAAIALNQFGFIDAEQKEAWMRLSTPTLATQHGWMEFYRALQDKSDQPRPPQRLVARSVEGYREGVVSSQTIATLRGVTVDVVERELAEAEVFPREQEASWDSADELPTVTVDLSALEELEDTDSGQGA